MAFDFAKIAKKQLDEIKRPPNPPVGTYEFAIMKIPSQDDYGEQWFAVNFLCRAVRATEDVDPTSLETYLDGKDISSIELRKTFLYDKLDERKAQSTEADQKDFLEVHCGLGTGMSMGEAMNNSVNAHFLGVVKWKQRGDNAERFDAQINNTAPVK